MLSQRDTSHPEAWGKMDSDPMTNVVSTARFFQAHKELHFLSEFLQKISVFQLMHFSDQLPMCILCIYKERVAGIILSGMLNDGSSGLWRVKRLGGLAIIQSPDDAQQACMPRNAMEYVDADYIVPAQSASITLKGIFTFRAVNIVCKSPRLKSS